MIVGPAFGLVHNAVYEGDVIVGHGTIALGVDASPGA